MNPLKKTLSPQKVKKYLSTTEKALGEVRITAPEKSYARKIALDFLSMAKSYYDDANHFYKNDNFVNAFACVNYAHGWLDAGARLGLFDVGGDEKLFTLAE